MDKKNLVIAFLLGALLVQPSKASGGYVDSAQIATAIIRGAKIIGLGAATSNTSGMVLDYRHRVRYSTDTPYWDFVKMVSEEVK